MKTLLLSLALLMTIENCSAQYCGGWRWKVKVLADEAAKAINFNEAQEITFEQLYKLDKIELNLGDWTLKRRKEELHFVKITGKILRWKVESNDHDYHIVVSDGKHFIVCEIPSPACDGVISTGHAAEYRAARDIINALPTEMKSGWHEVIQDGKKYKLSGVIFHDFKHAGEYSMPNCLEIHPIIRIEPIIDENSK